MGKSRLYPLLQQLHHILRNPGLTSHTHTHTHTHTHQSAGESDECNGVLWRLGDVQKVVEQRLVLVVGKLVKLVQQEYDTLIGV